MTLDLYSKVLNIAVSPDGQMLAST
jgi:hypothetical protein